MRLRKRDAYSDLRRPTGGGDGPSLTTVGDRPAGAEATTIPIGKDASIFAWHSSTPHDESKATHTYIILHGVARNADTYFKTLNKVWAKASDAGKSAAGRNTTIRVAPLFLSTERDSAIINSTTLGWGDPSAWVGGDGSTHPVGVDLSAFHVLDALLDKYADRKTYPAMKRITFLAHGAGAQLLQRYAVLGKDTPRSAVSVRYVVADPSSMLHFTEDRPEQVDALACPRFNDFRYGFNNYQSSYPLSLTRQKLFRRYLGRDVRYVIGTSDTRADKGDQLCGGVAMGGSARKDRSLNYWAYLHLLAGKSSIPTYPGLYSALDPKKAKQQAASSKTTTATTSATASTSASTSGILVNPLGAAARPTSSAVERKKFSTSLDISHRRYLVSGAGHSAALTLGSSQGETAIFG